MAFLLLLKYWRSIVIEKAGAGKFEIDGMRPAAGPIHLNWPGEND
jgi:hypothetical protein